MKGNEIAYLNEDGVKVSGNIKTDSCEYSILSLLWEYEEIPKRLLSISIPSFSLSMIYKTERELEEKKWIEKVKENSKTTYMLSLTELGKSIMKLQKLTEKGRNTIGKNKSSKTQYYKKTEVELMLRGIDVFVSTSEKPYLPVLLSYKAQTTFQYEEKDSKDYQTLSGKEIEEKLGKGIYYTSKEIRNAMKKSFGSEATAKSRFIGVLFFKAHFYIIFNTRSKMMRWSDTVELQTMKSIQNLISNWKEYRKYFESKEPIPSILFGTSSNMLASVVMGYSHGHIKQPIAEYNSKNIVTYPFLSGRNCNYKKMYFVSCDNYGIDTLRYLKDFSNASDIIKYADDYFAERDNFVSDVITELRRAKEFTDTSREVIFCLIPEINSLYSERRNGATRKRDTVLIADETYAKAISKCLGNEIAEVRNLSGNILNYPLFGNNGYYEGVTPSTTVKKKKDSKIQLSFFLDKEKESELRKISEEEKKSISEVIREALFETI